MYEDSNNDLPFGCYIIKVNALEKVCQQKNETDTENWDTHFISNPDLKINSIDVEEKYRHKTLKTSLDYPENYEFIKHVFSELYRQNTVFTVLEIIDLVKGRPTILNINANLALTKSWRQHQQRFQKGFVKQ